jgi:hypothetical protein
VSKHDGPRTGLFGKRGATAQQPATRAKRKPTPARTKAAPQGTGTGLFPKLEARRDARRATQKTTQSADHAAKRDAAISAAIKADKIKASRREHYARLYDADPAGTEQLLEMCAPSPGLNDQPTKPKPQVRPRGTGLFANRGRR